MHRNSFSCSTLFPKIKSISPKQKIINEYNEYNDDVVFAEGQYKKLKKDLFIQKLRKLKPWKRSCNNNIYFSSGKSNNFILRAINHKINTTNKNSISLTPKNIDWLTIGNYSLSEINNINNSLLLAKNFKNNDEIKRKFKIPKLNINNYIDNTKELCLRSIFSKMINSERRKIYKKSIEKEKNLEKECLNLSQDIQIFENFKKNNKNKFNLDEEILINLKKNKKIVIEEINQLSQEHRKIKDEIKKEIRFILHLKRYATFVHKLLGNPPDFINKEIKENINYMRLTDNDLNNLINNILSVFNALLTEKEFDESLNKILKDEEKVIIIFKIFQDNIMQINSKLDEITSEKMTIIDDIKNLKYNLTNRINADKKEYINLLKKYQKEKNQFEGTEYSINDKTNYKKNLLIELFEYIKELKLKNKENLDDKNFKKEIIIPLFRDIKQKENKINELISQIEIYSEENKEMFNKIINKLKQNNRLKKYYEERKIKEAELENKKNKIIEKVNQHIITGRNKYNSHIQFNKIKIQNEINPNEYNNIIDSNLIYY